MTTYSTNFGSYTAAAQPSDWTARWVTSNVTWLATTLANTEGGKVLRKASTADARRLLSWDAVSAHADSEGLIRFKASVVGFGAFLQTYLHLRGSGASGAETSYWVTFSTTNQGTLQLGKWVAGTATNLGTAYDNGSFKSATWYYLRFRVNGTSLQARIWEDGTVEPSAWQVSATDSAITAAGWAGVGNFESTGDIDIDFAAFGTAGDTAPLTSGTGTVALSQAVMEVANSGTPSTTVSQLAIEVANTGTPSTVVSQLVIEVAYSSVVATVQQPIVTVVC
jgi:hypothetical protein